MRRSGFTLLETVIALAIAVIVMGAALSANRVVQRNAQVAELKAEQEAILSDTIDLLTLSHNTLRSQSPATALPFSNAFVGLGVNAPLRIAPYRFRQQDPLSTTDPSVIKWCTPSDGSCTGIVSTAGPTSGNYTMSTALGAAGAEVIAVRKGAPVTGEPQVYDFTYLPTSGGVAVTSLFADSTVHQQSWDFFRRQVTITNRTANATYFAGYVATISVWPMFNGVNRQGDVVTRTVVFTEY
jgi:prepilin-type N-terminal cleavage/methylation domain-containing protein